LYSKDKIFVLDSRLEKDCVVLGKINGCNLLLLNNSLVTWFVLVPEVEETELYELDKETQLNLLETVNNISKFIKSEFKIDKLNIATIGNIVSQLHIHIIGRTKSDFCWPGVVWGADAKKSYSEKEIKEIVTKLSEKISGEFVTN
jgi:diadenosine tetraphosphate (Ap4A) HIT family hydrolase